MSLYEKSSLGQHTPPVKSLYLTKDKDHGETNVVPTNSNELEIYGIL